MTAAQLRRLSDVELCDLLFAIVFQLGLELDADLEAEVGAVQEEIQRRTLERQAAGLDAAGPDAC